jgi:hypothetical protein
MRWLFLAIVFFPFTSGTRDGAALAQPGRSGRLHFGWAATSITPDKPVALAGQYSTRITGNVRDPVTATALAIETRDDAGGIDQVVFVSCDLVAIRPGVVERMRGRLESLAPDLDASKVIVSATHSHTAPALADARETDWHAHDFSGSWAYRIPRDAKEVMQPAEYLLFLAERLGTVVARPWESRKPGSTSWALSHAVVAHNRRAVYADGSARMYGNTAEADFSHIEGASDHSVDILFFLARR